MSEMRDPKSLVPSEPPGTAPALAEYQPPAIAWEEPLEAIAAASCALIPLDCAGAPTA
jgi:hypothetical protein